MRAWHENIFVSKRMQIKMTGEQKLRRYDRSFEASIYNLL